MNFVLTVLLLCLAAFLCYRKQMDFLSPSLLVVLMFLLSSVMLSINGARWEYSIHFNTILVILVALVVFWLGEEWGGGNPLQIFKERNWWTN